MDIQITESPLIALSLNPTLFEHWLNLAKHLSEQIGYFGKANCLGLVIYERSVHFECKEAAARLRESSNNEDATAPFLRLWCRTEDEYNANFELGAAMRRNMATFYCHSCSAVEQNPLEVIEDDGLELHREYSFWLN